MKHVHTISFLAKLWRAFDNFGRLIGEGYIDSRGNAQYYQHPSQYYRIDGEQISKYEVLEDVNNQITILQRQISR